jgi:hypothetical protein
VLRTVFGPKREEGSGENYILMSLMMCTPRPTLFGNKIEKNKMGGQVAHKGERRGIYRVWWGNLRQKDHLGDPSVDGR